MESGFIKSIRNKDYPLLAQPLENHLLYVIAHRARRTPDLVNKLEVGEALIGDHKKIGLTRQKYRTAVRHLLEWQFITIRTTKRGTIAKLLDSNTYDLNILVDNHQDNQILTISQPSANHQLTTNKNVKKEKNVNNDKNKDIRRFTPPALHEVIDYFVNQESTIEQANTFFDHFLTNGWKVGGKTKTPMKDWKAAIRNWIRRGKGNGQSKFSGQHKESTAERTARHTRAVFAECEAEEARDRLMESNGTIIQGEVDIL